MHKRNQANILERHSAVIAALLICIGIGCSKSDSQQGPSNNTATIEDGSPSTSTEQDHDELTGEASHIALFDTYAEARNIVNAVLEKSYVKNIAILSAQKIKRFHGDRIIHQLGIVEGRASDGSTKKIAYDIRFLRTLNDEEVKIKCYYAMVKGQLIIDKRSDMEVAAVLDEEVRPVQKVDARK